MIRIVAVVLLGATLVGSDAQAQARGPSASEVLEKGQDVSEQRDAALAAAFGLEGELPRGARLRYVDGRPVLDIDGNQLELKVTSSLDEELDDATRATKLVQMQTWLTRLPGRFRIAGEISKPDLAIMGRLTSLVMIGTTASGDITGVAECASVGDGFAVTCIINATWPVIDQRVQDLAPKERSKASEGGPRYSNSEALKTFSPALLDIGLDLVSPGIRALLVTDESIAHLWAGRVEGDTLMTRRLTGCKVNLPKMPPDYRCLQRFEITAKPDGEIVTIVLQATAVTLTFTMYRDPDAQVGKPMKKKKVR